METDDANGRRKCLNESRLLAFSASTRLKTVAVILSAKDKATKNFENYKQMIIYNIFFYGILIYKT